MQVTSIPAFFAAILCLALPACKHQDEGHHEAHHKVSVTNPLAEDVVLTQQYVCNIHSSRHIAICALQDGYLEEIPVKEGQAIKKGDVMFRILPTLYKARLDAEIAEAELAHIKFHNSQRLFEQKVVSQPEVAMAQAEYSKAQAKVTLAQAELNFATIIAPFDGIMDQQMMQQGSYIDKGDKLTTLSDNNVMWVYFNVPEARYLEYKKNKGEDDLKVELLLNDGETFEHLGKIGAIEADFNNETGNIAFRADFPNPDRLLRNGQVGTIVLSRVKKGAIVIPQRATYETLAKKYVYVVEDAKDHAPGDHTESPDPLHRPKPVAAKSEEHADEHADHTAKSDLKHGIAKQREIEILSELDDIFLIKGGIGVNDKIVLEGVRQVRDGEEVEYEYVAPQDALKNLKHHAE